MDVDDSDGELSLPTGLDPAVKTDLNDDTLSTFQSATVTEPQLPNRARKRTNEEIYEKVQRPFVSTTPLKSPPRNPVSARAMSEPFHERGTSFDKVGFSALRDVTKANQETSARTRSNDEPDSEMAGEETPEQEADAETFTDQINSYKQELQRDFAEYEKALACKSQTDTQELLDWGDLETRYRRDMQPLTAEEEKVTAEFEARFQQFLLWMRVSGEKEGERAIKRLRTRVAYVQNSERQLASRQQHYTKVLNAFQGAMALLGSS